MEPSSVASEPGAASTNRAAEAMYIDTESEQSTLSQAESEDKKLYTNTNLRGNMSTHDSSEMQ